MKTILFSQMKGLGFTPAFVLLTLLACWQPSTLEAQFQNHFTTVSYDLGMSGVDVNNNQYKILQQVVDANNYDILLSQLDLNGFLAPNATRIGSTQKEEPVYLQKTLNATGQHDGYIIVGQTTYGNTSGKFDLFLIRTDLSGGIKWSKRYGKALSNEYAYCVIQMPDQGFVAVGYSEEPGKKPHVYVLKTDKSGGVLWNRTYNFTFGTKGFYVDYLNSTTSALYVTGVAQYTATNKDVLLIKINPSNGNADWAKRYWHKSDNSWNEIGRCVRVAKNNTRIVITGTTSTYEYTLMTNLDGTTVWGNRYAYSTQTLQPCGVVRTDALGNNLLIGGTIINGNSRKAYFHKIDATGANVSFKTYYWDTTGIALNDVRQVFNGGFLGVGYYTGLNDTYVLRTNDQLNTPATCSPTTLGPTKTSGIYSKSATPTTQNMETFTFPVTTSNFTQTEHRCYGAVSPLPMPVMGEDNNNPNMFPGSYDILLYPNPITMSQSRLTVKLSSPVSGASLQVIITDISGRRLAEMVLLNEETDTFEIEVGNLPEGMYALSILQENQLSGTARFVRVK